MLLKKLGKYEIIDWLGGGRFGDVFLARDTILEKDFALKISRMHKEEIAMLKDEARLLASLDHPNIVRFYNIDFVENKFVLVMEYVKGKTLRSVITAAGIDMRKALDLMGQSIDAVNYAHCHNVLHRDLKPENILITEINNKSIVKIADFGLARFIKTGSISASTAGTPVYMAPEAWSGNFNDKSDIWSIGIILYELLTGVPPFLDDSLDGLKTKIEKHKFLMPTVLRPEIPEYLEEAIVKTLSLNPHGRPKAGELLEKLTGSPPAVQVKTSITIPERTLTTINLTPAQKEIIDTVTGKILVLGQAGCGKTTTLTYAIGRLIGKGIPVSKILVSTFTTKAAKDIMDRLQKCVSFPIYDLWLGTLHTIGMKILRRDAERIDLDEDFIIREPKEIFTAMKIKSGKYRSNAIIKHLGMLMAQAITPEKYQPKNRWESFCLEVYGNYQTYKKENSILDYEDLILYAIKLLEEHEDIREYYQQLFDYIFVDELQDINPAQYRLISLLGRNNMFFTGDEDQAIYGWRGAEKELLYQVPKDYPAIKIFYLTTSFRVPQSILEIANNLMLRQATAIPKAEMGDVSVYAATSEQDEANYLINEIRNLKKEKYSFQEIAILYRMNYISRIYEETLAKAHIPHTLIGGISFYARAEIRPLIEYLELLEKTSSRKDVKGFLGQAEELFNIRKSDLARANKIFEYHKLHLNFLSPATIIDGVLKVTNLKSENIDELQAFAVRYPARQLARFLNEIKLAQELDLVDWGKDTVKLMTIHSAKGLEFPVVFLVDLAEDIFPLTKKMAAQKELAEERRLCYVALTRAQKKLYLLYPKWRYGRYQKPSRFLVDMFKTKPQALQNNL